MGLDLSVNGSSETMYDKGDRNLADCVIVSIDVMSDHIGHQDASHGGGCSKTSAYIGQFGWASMI